MKHIITAMLTLIALSPVSADPLFPMASVVDVTDENGWAVGVGAGFEYETEYDGSDNYGLELEPSVAIQRRQGNSVWFLEGPELGLRTRIADTWLVQGGLRLEGGREESEADQLAGLGDTDDELTGMIEVRRGLGGDWSNWVAGRLMAGGSDIGVLGVAAIGHTFASAQPGSGVDVFLFSTFGSSAFINRDFGINAAQSEASGLAQTRLDSGYRSVGIQAVGRWRFGSRWQIQAEAGYERYNNDIASSPIAQDDFEAEVGASLIYRF